MYILKVCRLFPPSLFSIFFPLDTTGLQEASVILNSTLSSITVTCIFAEGSTALGCQALLIDGMTLVMVNVSSGDTVAMTTVLLPLGAQLNDVLIAEVLQNGEVSAIRRTIETSATTQQQSSKYVYVYGMNLRGNSSKVAIIS